MLKTIIVAGLLSLGLLAFSPTGPARADTNVDIGIGLGGGYDSGPYYRPARWGISCREGQRIVRRAGFRGVHARNCRGSRYEYIGYRHERAYRIIVNSRSGSIRDIERIRRGGGGGYDDDDNGYDSYDDYDDEY